MVYRRLIKTEQQQSAAQKVKWALGKQYKGSIASVDIIQDGERVVITHKEALEKYVWTQ